MGYEHLQEHSLGWTVFTNRQKVKGPVKLLPAAVLTHSDVAWVLG